MVGTSSEPVKGVAPSCQLRTCGLVSQSGHSFAEDYIVTEESLGAGMSGDVFLAEPVGCKGLSTAATSVAVKTLSKVGLSKQELAALMHEVDIFLQMDHCNIARLLQVYDEPNDVYLVMEYCAGGSLFDTLQRSGQFSEQTAAETMRQVLNAVNYCHSHPRGKVCHHDLKPENFVYKSASADSELKLVDFGLSKILSTHRPTTRSSGGTPGYKAPEVLSRSDHDESCDMWSLGAIMYVLLTGEMLSEDSNFQLDASLLAGMSSDAKDLLQSLLSVDPQERPTAYEALQHPWIAQLVQPCPDLQLQGSCQQRDMLHSVCSFARGSPVYRAVALLATYVQGNVVASVMDSADEQFRAIDEDCSGTISLKELAKPLQNVLGLSAAESRDIFCRLDLDSDLIINRSEFLAAVAGPLLLKDERIVREAFCRFDANHDGKICFREWSTVLGQDFCGESTMQLFQELDVNGDHAVDWEEFSLMISRALMMFHTVAGSHQTMDPAKRSHGDKYSKDTSSPLIAESTRTLQDFLHSPLARERRIATSQRQTCTKRLACRHQPRRQSRGSRGCSRSVPDWNQCVTRISRSSSLNLNFPCA